MRVSKCLGIVAILGIFAGGSPSLANADASPTQTSDEQYLAIGTSRLVVSHSPLARISGRTLSHAVGRAATVLSSSTAVRSVVSLGANLRGEELQDVIESIEALPGVTSVQPSIRMQRFVSPNDDYFDQPLGVDDAGQYHLRSTSVFYGAANLQNAWASGTGSSDTVIAIVDTGYTDHVDLDDTRIVAEADMIADIPTANDGGGRDSDAHDPGDWIDSDDQLSGDFPPEYCDISDSSWHGTHVTGIAAATTNNGTGVAGVNWAAKLVQVRALGKCGGWSDDIADGIRWAAGDTVPGISGANPFPADVINMSLGAGSDDYPIPCDDITQDAIDYAVSQGAVVVVAAGNSNSNAANINPANCDNVITVGATDAFGEKTSFSNYGSVVDIAAPGLGILSTFNEGMTFPTAGTYAFADGTSMASPLVAGIVSLMRGADPTITAAEVEQALKATARPFGANPGVPLGAGLVTAGGTYAASSVKVTVDNNDLKISFTKSDNADSYIIKRGTKTIKSNLAGSATSFSDRNRATIAGNYTYKIIAVQNDGTRSREASATFQVKVPPKPEIFVSTGIESVRVQVRFSKSTPSAKSWCVYIDNRLSGCSPASKKSLIINTTRGSHSIFVRSSTLKGTSAKSSTITVNVP